MRSPFFHISKILLSLLLSGLVIDARAEYYVVYPGSEVMYTSNYGYETNRARTAYGNCGRSYNSNSCYRSSNYDCGRCYKPAKRQCQSTYTVTTYYINSSAPRRHSQINAEEMAEYAWIPTPEAP